MGKLDSIHLLSLNNIFFAIKCKGKNIWWSHIKDLYERELSAGMGLRLVPKLKYEHINITSFSAMRVDLAAQVSNTMCC